MKNNFKKISKLLKALGDESRLNILQEISNSENKCTADDDCKQESCVKNISEDLKLSKSTVSHHIKVLIETKVIRTKKQGRYIYCEINQDTLKELINFINQLKKE